MKPILFEATETAFTSNGLGRIDARSCHAIEERNGQFEVEMVISIDDPHYADVQEGRRLLVRHDDTTDLQPFEIYQISRPINGEVTVYAHHISYQTEKITVMPFTASSVSGAMAALPSKCVGGSTFTFWTDKTTVGNYKVEKPTNLRSILGGTSGSLLDVYGTGEYEWDKYTIRLHARRGRHTDVVLRYGKDITDLKKTTDLSNVWTGVVPFWQGNDVSDPETTVLVTLPEVAVYSQAASSFPYQMVIPLDLSSQIQSMPTEAQLRSAAQTYVANNAHTAIPSTIDISFVALWQTDEYKDVAPLQRLSLCDTLKVVYTKLGVDNTAKIVKTVYDVLQERYDSMTIGDVRPNLASTLTGGLQSAVDEIRGSMVTRNRAESMMQGAIDNATNLLTGGAGGHIVIGRDANGCPNEIFAMNTDDVTTATNVLRINVNGIGFSSTGIGGPYTSAWTLDGQFVADFITAGTLSANRIAGGVLTDLTGNNSWDLTTGAMNFQNLSWTSQNSSMTSTGVLSCSGAEITGKLEAYYGDNTAGERIKIESGRMTLLSRYNGTEKGYAQLYSGYQISQSNRAVGMLSYNGARLIIGAKDGDPENYGSSSNLFAVSPSIEFRPLNNSIELTAYDLYVNDPTNSTILQAYTGRVDLSSASHLSFQKGICIGYD